MKQKFAGLILFVLVLALIFVLVATTSPASATVACPVHRRVEQWTNLEQLAAHGFYVEQYSSSASYTFVKAQGEHYMALDLGPTLDNSYAASRITEIDTSVPVSERVKCWEPTVAKHVVAEYAIRFDQLQAPFLTENVFLWNAPYGDDPVPLTAFGVTRSVASGGQYAAIIAEDVSINPDMSISGNLYIMPMPAWLDASEWHTVRVTITQTSASVDVKQGGEYVPVLSAGLTHPPEPVGLEYSVDNELFPGLTVPVFVEDGVDIGTLDIRLSQ